MSCPVDIDVSSGKRMNYSGLTLKERGVISFVNKNEDWGGTYQLFFFDNENKENEQDFSAQLTTNTNQIDMEIVPEDLNLEAQKYYYEIFDSSVKRRLFFGTFEISL